MITIIGTKVDVDVNPNVGQNTYTRNLIEYMDTAERKDSNSDINRFEKCVMTASGNLSRNDMNSEEIAAEMNLLLKDTKVAKTGEGIDHWVLSFEGGELPAEKVVEIGHEWVKQMGYSNHPYHMAVHDDTDHRHLHIALCRYDLYTGKIKPRGFWKNDNQKALVRIADKYGLDVEEGTKKRFKLSAGKPVVETHIDSVTNDIEKTLQKEIIQLQPETMPENYYPGQKAARAEIHSGFKADTRILRERLLTVYNEIKDKLPDMKWGQIHKRLAEAGLQMERREHTDKNGNVKYGMVFSMDGENWTSATNLGLRELSWSKLNEAVNRNSANGKVKEWRKINADALEILNNSRQQQAHIEPAIQNTDTETAKELRKQQAKVIFLFEKQEKRLQKLIDKKISIQRYRKIVEEFQRSLRRRQLYIRDKPINNGNVNTLEMIFDNLIMALDSFFEAFVEIGRVIKQEQERKHRLANIDAQLDILEGKINELETYIDNQLSTAFDMRKPVYTGKVELTVKQQEKIMNELTKAGQEGLRGVNIETAREKAKEIGLLINPDNQNKVRNGLDVFVYEYGLGFQKGVETAATLFPEAMKAGERVGVTTYKNAIAEAKKLKESRGKEWKEPSKYGNEIGEAIVKYFKALQLKDIDVNVRVKVVKADNTVEVIDVAELPADQFKQIISENTEKMPVDITVKATEKRDMPYSKAFTDLDITNLLAMLRTFMAIEAKGTKDIQVHTFISPRWHDGRVAIMIDDAQEEKVKEAFGRPSAILNTSDRSRQYFYIFDSKDRPKEFFDSMIKTVNVKYGDPKIEKVGHNTRLAGFRNMKYATETSKGPMVAIDSFDTSEPVKFTKWIDKEWQKWQKEQEEKKNKIIAEPVIIQKHNHHATPDANYKPVKDIAGINGKPVKEVAEMIQIEPLPDWVVNDFKGIQASIVADAERYVKAGIQKYVDRSDADFMTARAMHASGLGMNQVASFLYHYGLQDETPVMRPYGADQKGAMHETVRINNDREKLRKARLTAANAAPVEVYSGSWRALNPDKDEKPTKRMWELYGDFIKAEREKVKKMYQSMPSAPSVSEAQVIADRQRQINQLQDQGAINKPITRLSQTMPSQQQEQHKTDTRLTQTSTKPE